MSGAGADDGRSGHPAATGGPQPGGPVPAYEHTLTTFQEMTAGLPKPPRPPRAGRRRVAPVLVAALVVGLLVIGGVVVRGAMSTGTAHPGPVDVQGAPARLATDQPAAGRDEDPTCPQKAGGIAGTRPTVAVTARVDAAWKRIEAWLDKRAPRDAAALAGPATVARIDAAQKRMSVPFPPDLVASLRRHDGLTERGVFALPPFYLPLGTKEIVNHWTVGCAVLTDQPDMAGHDWWHRQFVPFAGSVDGGCLVVDQRPGGHGRVGEFYDVEGTSFERWPASITDLLEGVASSLESGTPYAGSYRPYAGRDGHLHWHIG